MDTVALIRRIVRVTNKLSSSCAVLHKEELLKFVSQGLGGNDKGVTIRTLQRDFEVISEIFDIKIGYSKERRGYRHVVGKRNLV